MTGWSINAAELRIPRSSRFAAHRMIVIADPKLDAVRQLNGLASWLDPASAGWLHKPIGYLPSDRLRGYDSAKHPRTFMPINGCAPRSRALHQAVDAGAVRVLANGLTAAEVEARLAPALEALTRINALSAGPEGGAGLRYPFLGFGRNSNSFFSTMLHAMGFEEPVFARSAFIVPGARGLLLAKDVLAEIRQSSAAMTGARKSVTPSAMASTPRAVG
ncbi:MAG: hypothetical protein KAX84_07210 [Burkholderiales bacterium]|nr:hypothetical protein [Burkholderiales bacterium]